MGSLDDLRIRLDQTSERIVSRLKDRSRLPLNMPVYTPGTVFIRGRPGISLLQFAIEGMEAYHASLGRYEYKDQQPMFYETHLKSEVARMNTDTRLSGMRIRLVDDILTFYQRLLPELCSDGEDPSTYGETVYIDADLLELIHERVNAMGRNIAQSKLESNPGIISSAKSADASGLEALLRDPVREKDVIEKAKDVAERYGLDTKITADVFKWIMGKTLEVEVAYLQGVARQT